MSRLWIFAMGLVACRSSSEQPPPQVDRAPVVAAVDAAPAAAFVRIPAELAEGAYYIRRAPGEIVGNMPRVGELICQLETRFGPPDPYVALFSHDPPTLAFPLQHVATGYVIVPFPESHGYAGGLVVVADAGTRVVDDPERGSEQKTFAKVADELDALLATTRPIDCEHTFDSPYRVNRAGVRGGQPFFEHLELATTLDRRLAQFEHNDNHGGKRKDKVDEELCGSLAQNWSERTLRVPGYADAFPDYPRGDLVKARLLRCLLDAVGELETDVAADGFNADWEREEVESIGTRFEDLELDDPELAERIRRLRVAVKRGR